MRILIDECVDERLRHSFPDHDCQTARYAGFGGVQNGLLLDGAETAGFDVILTVDQGMPFQQAMTGRKIAVLVLCAPTNRLKDLLTLVSAASTALSAILPGQVVKVANTETAGTAER